jgi:hypothetical protein
LVSYAHTRATIIGRNEKRMRAVAASLTSGGGGPKLDAVPVFLRIPMLLHLECLQCGKAKMTLLVYQGPDGPDVALFPQQRGAGSPKTPADVAYYLDQARRAASVGARSAAAAMYRSAVELMLYGLGYKQRMLGPKLEALKKDKATGTASVKALRFDDDFGDIARMLGNGAIHAGKAAATKQQGLDVDVVAALEETIDSVLWRLYDEPARDSEHRKKLRRAARKLKGK